MKWFHAPGFARLGPHFALVYRDQAHPSRLVVQKAL
jgi:hypothetical protein